MSTYKIGNKVKAIIRSCAAGPLGDTEMLYDNQPYTVLKDLDITLEFADKDVQAKRGPVVDLDFNYDTLARVRMSNVLLTNKILALIYKPNDLILCSKQAYLESDDEGMIYLDEEHVGQVFVYDEEGNLEAAYGEITDGKIAVSQVNATYSVYYSYEGEKSFNFNKPANYYVTLDFETIANENDQTTPMCIHVEKCVLSVNKTMFMSRGDSNTIDITAKVINTGKDYITIK